MTYTINLTKTALADIRAAVHYIMDNLFNEQAANKLLDDIDEELSLLSEMPFINPLVSDSFLAANGIRIQMVNKYMAFYVVHEEEKTVSVIRFQHSRRDWITLLKRDINNNNPAL